MLSRAGSQPGSTPTRLPPPIPPKLLTRYGQVSSPSTKPVTPSASIFSKYFMNDIPRGTRRIKLINYLLLPPHCQDTSSTDITSSETPKPNVLCGVVIADSSLDDELSVATIEFSDTPKWLKDLNNDPNGFPKKTALGTLWRGIDMTTGEPNEQGQTEFIRATIQGDLLYAEALAEFAETDVNIQDTQGRTALHWACANGIPDMVELCLSVIECQIGLRDHDGFTAFDISLRSATHSDVIPTLFYGSMFRLDEDHPQVALLRALTVTSDPVGTTPKPIFPGVALFDPVLEQNLPLVSALLDRGVDLTAKNQAGSTALHLAVSVGNTIITSKLLEAGSNVNAIDNRGLTPLQSAAHSGDEMVQLLQRWEANAASRLPESLPAMTALEVSLPVSEREEVIHQGNYETTNEAGLTALLRAAKDGDLRTVLRLLSLGADVNSVDRGRRTSLHLAAMGGHSEILVALLDGGADIEAVNQSQWTALHTAANSGHTEAVKVLVAGGANTEAVYRSKLTALFIAVRNGHSESVRALLAGGANVGVVIESDRTALHVAAFEGHSEIVQALLVGGADIGAVDKSGYTVLRRASERGHTVTVQALLAGGADVEEADTSNHTALLLAARHGHTETVRALLAGGADVEAVNISKYTALHLAAFLGYTESVQALLAGGADVGAVDTFKHTALHKAAAYGNSDTIQALLTGGADINHAGKLRVTPLHLAAHDGNPETIKLLLQNGAQIEARSKTGTALEWATNRGHREVVEVLLAAGARNRLLYTLRHSLRRK